MRSLLVNLKSPLLFRKAQRKTPTDADIQSVLYDGKARVHALRGKKKGLFGKEQDVVKKEFTDQWIILIRKLQSILKTNLDIDIGTISIGEALLGKEKFLFNLLTQDIINSMGEKDAGLLPKQKDIVFEDLKTYLEEICFYFLNPENKEAAATERSVLKDLYRNLQVCGPGLYQHVQSAVGSLYGSVGFDAWLAECRTEIVRRLAGAKIHRQTAFFTYAGNSNWNLLETSRQLSDPYAGVSAEELTQFHQDFEKSYRKEAIAFVATRLKEFLEAEIAPYENRRVPFTGEKWIGFYQSVEPILNSCYLRASDVFNTIEDETMLELSASAMDNIDLLVMHALTTRFADVHSENIINVNSILIDAKKQAIGYPALKDSEDGNTVEDKDTVFVIQKNEDDKYDFSVLFACGDGYISSEQYVQTILGEDSSTTALCSKLAHMSENPDMRHRLAAMFDALLLPDANDRQLADRILENFRLFLNNQPSVVVNLNNQLTSLIALSEKNELFAEKFSSLLSENSNRGYEKLMDLKLDMSKNIVSLSEKCKSFRVGFVSSLINNPEYLFSIAELPKQLHYFIQFIETLDVEIQKEFLKIFFSEKTVGPASDRTVALLDRILSCAPDEIEKIIVLFGKDNKELADYFVKRGQFFLKTLIKTPKRMGLFIFLAKQNDDFRTDFLGCSTFGSTPVFFPIFLARPDLIGELIELESQEFRQSKGSGEILSFLRGRGLLNRIIEQAPNQLSDIIQLGARAQYEDFPEIIMRILNESKSFDEVVKKLSQFQDLKNSGNFQDDQTKYIEEVQKNISSLIALYQLKAKEIAKEIEGSTFARFFASQARKELDTLKKELNALNSVDGCLKELNRGVAKEVIKKELSEIQQILIQPVLKGCIQKLLNFCDNFQPEREEKATFKAQ